MSNCLDLFPGQNEKKAGNPGRDPSRCDHPQELIPYVLILVPQDDLTYIVYRSNIVGVDLFDRIDRVGYPR